jgi:hypothetical protein
MGKCKGRNKGRKRTETMNGKARMRTTKGGTGRDFYSLIAADESKKLVIKYRTTWHQVAEDRRFTGTANRTSEYASVCGF